MIPTDPPGRAADRADDEVAAVQVRRANRSSDRQAEPCEGDPASRASPETSMRPGEGTFRRVAAEGFTYGEETSHERRLSVPVEAAVEMAYGGVPFAVMMLTPDDLEDFAYGFSLTEGIVRSAHDIRGIVVETVPAGLRIDTSLQPGTLARHFARRRAMSGRTGCGLCGIEDLASLDAGETRAVRPPSVAIEVVQRAVAALDAAQVLNGETRSVHAAAWVDLEGRILHLREDVGRHNALDKLIGRLARDGVRPGDGFVVITSRCSFEMVDKVAAFGAGMLVAVSAPTSLALDRAERLGMALLGIARKDGVTAFVGRDALVTTRAFA